MAVVAEVDCRMSAARIDWITTGFIESGNGRAPFDFADLCVDNVNAFLPAGRARCIGRSPNEFDAFRVAFSVEMDAFFSNFFFTYLEQVRHISFIKFERGRCQTNWQRFPPGNPNDLFPYRIESRHSSQRRRISSRNDAIGNVAVMLAALGVLGTGAAWPDIFVAGVMGVLGWSAAKSVIRQAQKTRNGVRRRR